MLNFSVTTLLINNTFEFCPNTDVSPEWQRLLYEEFYNEWSSDESIRTHLERYMDKRFDKFMDQLKAAYVEPVFKSKNIEELPGGKYRVTVQVEGSRVRQVFDTLDAARLFRNQMTNHPTVGGMQANPLKQAA